MKLLFLNKNYAAAILSLVLRRLFGCRKISNNRMIFIRYENKTDIVTNFGLMIDLIHKIVL